MEILFLPTLFGVTSVIAWAVRALRSTERSTRRTGQQLLAFAGLWAICLVANVALGGLVILGLRALARVFVSIYVLNDVSVVILSALQSFVVHTWMQSWLE
jgi:hypothetical protein